MTDYARGRADALKEAEALIDEAYDERDKWLFKYRDAVRLIMEINQFLASKGIVHPTKLSNQIISTIKDATEHIGSLAQQPQEDKKPKINWAEMDRLLPLVQEIRREQQYDKEPERGCGTCNSWTGSRCVDLEFPIRDCINDSYSEWQPKEGA